MKECTALVLAGPRREHHNPPPVRRLADVDPVALVAVIGIGAEVLGVDLPPAVRLFTRCAREVLMRRMEDEVRAGSCGKVFPPG